ncbi:14486_t:CDS:2 [Acaulospora morrowiae]|uniref:14486_t:CDS:1 n=1 Tax=Acaulospora morrowiae TaxID=94023 RepID=A0A9N9BII5_9GLOM|nr:14486_t:CDS:2 [Acaulospora morrowiae]
MLIIAGLKFLLQPDDMINPGESSRTTTQKAMGNVAIMSSRMCTFSEDARTV